jgi:SAM-dependent MidA family methyltransferase
VPDASGSGQSPEEEAGRLGRVAEAIRRRADSAGFVPFDQFQAVALYAPGVGYYESPQLRLGSAGDFYTAAHVTPLFGATLAGRIVAEHERLGRPRRFRVVEVGPGDGTLAREIVQGLASGLSRSTEWEYVLVERSAPLRSLAEERLASSTQAGRVRVASALSADGPFVGVVLADEFLDAQPTRRLRFSDGRWQELGVRWDGARFTGAQAALRPIIGAPLPETAPEGAILELSPAAEGFVRELSDHLVEGAAIVLDYGDEEPQLLRRPPPGTLQAIRGHRALEDAYDQPGSADLSTFVNFTRIRAVGRAVGLGEEYYGPQSEALGNWGFEARFKEALATVGSGEAEVRLRLSVKNLLFGFDRFRALVWHAGERVPAT